MTIVDRLRQRLRGLARLATVNARVDKVIENRNKLRKQTQRQNKRMAEVLDGVGKEQEIPIPPPEMRWLVGPTEVALFDNPRGDLVFPSLPQSAYKAVFDFGCGCGRIARQLLQQNPRPSRYVGIDINREMIEWCQTNLSPIDSNFQFHHHDVFSPSHGSDNTQQLIAPFEVEDSAFSLIVAISVFTHLYEQQTIHYLREIARIMSPDGIFISSWFLFDKREFAVMQENQNTLFISEINPTSAVIYDRDWLRKTATESGLTIVDVKPPNIRGYHWVLVMEHQKPGDQHVNLPADTAPYGSWVAPFRPQE